MPGPTVADTVCDNNSCKHSTTNGSSCAGHNDISPAAFAVQVWAIIDRIIKSKAFQPTAELLSFVEPLVAEPTQPIQSKELEDPKENKFTVRVTLCYAEEDYAKGAHEIVEIDAGDTFDELRRTLTRQFKKISKMDVKARANLKGHTWSEDDKISKVKVMYTGSNGWDITGDQVSETVLTEENCSRTLGMLKTWGGKDYLCVTVVSPAESVFEDE